MKPINTRKELVRILKEDLHLWVECPECEMKFRLRHAGGIRDGRPAGGLPVMPGKSRGRKGRKSVPPPREMKSMKWKQRRTFR